MRKFKCIKSMYYLEETEGDFLSSDRLGFKKGEIYPFYEPHNSEVDSSCFIDEQGERNFPNLDDMNKNLEDSFINEFFVELTKKTEKEVRNEINRLEVQLAKGFPMELDIATIERLEALKWSLGEGARG